MSKIPAAAVQFVKVSNEALGASMTLLSKMAEEKKAAQALIPGIVEQLKKAGWIDEHEAKMAAAQLGNHNEALAILSNCIGQAVDEVKKARAKAASSDFGSPDEDATVLTGNQKNANYLGYRHGDDDPLPESTRALAAGLGVKLSR